MATTSQLVISAKAGIAIHRSLVAAWRRRLVNIAGHGSHGFLFARRRYAAKGFAAPRYRLAATVWLGASFVASSTSPQPQFYQATADQRVGRPGTLIRSEPMPFAPAGAQATRILYRSTGL